MKSNLRSWMALLSVCASFASVSASAAEDWKGAPPANTFTVGAVQGFAPILGVLGYGALAHVGVQLIRDGLVPDVADSLFLEAELGANWTKPANYFIWSLHARWDFVKDSTWTFFGLLGFSGFNGPGITNLLIPRVGAGALWRVSDVIDIRGEFSHELVGVGIQIPLYL